MPRPLLGAQEVNLMVGDIYGEDDFQKIRTSYLKGSHGFLFVVDGTRKATLEVEHTRRYLDAVIDAIPQPLLVKDRQHRYVTVTAAFCSVMGQTKEALIGRSDADFLSPDRVAEAYAEDDCAFASHTPVIFQGGGRSAATAERWYLRNGLLPPGGAAR